MENEIIFITINLVGEMRFAFIGKYYWQGGSDIFVDIEEQASVSLPFTFTFISVITFYFHIGIVTLFNKHFLI